MIAGAVGAVVVVVGPAAEAAETVAGARKATGPGGAAARRQAVDLLPRVEGLTDCRAGHMMDEPASF